MSEGLRAFDAMWERIRQPNEELQPRVMAWLREFVPTINAERLFASAGAYLTDEQWRINLNLYGGTAGDFYIAPTVPVEPTEAAGGRVQRRRQAVVRPGRVIP